MDRKDFRTLLSKLSGASRSTSHPGRAATLLASVGRAMGVGGAAGRAPATLEPLEGRALLEGSFASPIAAILLNPTTGRGASIAGGGANNINPAVGTTDNDFFTFVAPTTDFVTVLADTSNESPVSGLNTRVQVYNASHVLVAQGSNNGILTSHDYGAAGTPARDGWAGFVAQAGQTYFVVVSNDTGGTVSGTYTLRINGLSTAVDIGGDLPTDTGIAREHNSPIPNPGPPPVLPTPILGQLGGVSLPVTTRLRQDNIVYKLVIPSDPKWDNLLTINAQSSRPAGANQATSTRLDTHLEIYNVQGQLVAIDSDAGRLQDAFATVRSHPGDVYYIRVRSDEILSSAAGGNIQIATGPFWLVIDALATVLPIDPVTRRGNDPAGAMAGFGPPTVPPNPTMPTASFQTALYEFTSQGTGLAIITQRPTGLSPVTDGALHLYDDTGTLIAFIDNFGGADPQIEAQLIGGHRYFVVVDSFAVPNGVQFTLHVESNHTFNTFGSPSPIDDHVTTPAPLPNNPTQAQRDAYRRQFELATALTWGTPFPTLDADNNVVRDRGLRTTATGTGRLQAAGDTDLFQFTPQVSMLQNYAGNNDDAGTALYVGGSFTVADPNNPWPTTSRDLTIWDASDYFYTGNQSFDPNFNVTYGFNDNPDTAATSRPEIYAMMDYDPGTPANVPQGMSRHWLVVGGDFDLIIPTPLGPVTFKNLAVWAQDWNTGRWGWNSLGDFNGPVRALTTYLPGDQIPARDDPATQIPTGRPLVGGQPVPYLVLGGSFDDAAGTAANNIATFDVVNGFQAIGTGTNGPVFALTSYDPSDVGDNRPHSDGPPVLPAVANSRDVPNSLIVGGSFTDFDGQTVSNIAMWDGVDPNNVWMGPFDLNVNVSGAGPNGPVFALTTYAGWDPDGMAGETSPIDAPARTLIIGGAFSTIHDGEGNNIAAANLAAWGFLGTAPHPTRFPALPPPATRDPAQPNYAPQGGWQQIGAGVTAPNANGDPIEVRALTQWDPPDINNTTIDPLLIIGGAFNVAGQDNIVAFAVNANATPPVALGFGWLSGTTGTSDPFGGTGGEVRTLTTLTDAQEPSIAEDLNSGVPQQVLYVGGDFTLVNDGLQNVAASHVMQYSAIHNPNTGLDEFHFFAMNGGVDNVDPNDPAPTVFALGAFDDGNPVEWDRHDRISDRLQIVVSPVDGSFVNTRVRVFDSNFNLVYDFTRPGSETISPPFPDPSGMLDPSLENPPNSPIGPLDPTLSGIRVWAGETYYLEVSDSTGGGTGRYSITVTADALPSDLNGDRTLDDVNAQIAVPATEGHFQNAINLAPPLGTGDTTNRARASILPFGGIATRTQHITPAINDNLVNAEDLGNIATIDDTELYSFRAEFTGAAEIRIQTIDLPDEYGQMQASDTSTFVGETKTYTSHLDAALRIFRNDFEQIAYNDDNLAISGERQDDSVGFAVDRFDPQNNGQNATLQNVYPNDSVAPFLPGTPIRAQFTRKDPRVVINVVAGNNYFIQVEAGQKYKDGSPRLIADRPLNIPREIDQRFVNGGFRILLNAMPEEHAEVINGQPVIDDHSNQFIVGGVLNNAFATPIPIGDNPADSTTNGIGSITGVIRDTPNNPGDGGANHHDLDLFTFIAPGSGTMNIRVTRTGAGNTLNPALTVFQFNHATGVYTGVAQGAPISPGVVGVTLNALTGDTYFFGVAGSGGSQGAYRVDVNGIPARDDVADFAKFFNAPEIHLFDFQGQGSVNGALESRGDTDVYKFHVVDFANFNLTLTSHSASLNPAVTIYEVSEDPSGNPIFLRIGSNDGGGAGGQATVTFPVTPDRIEVVPPPGQNREYPYYYVLVRGSDPNADFGAYTLGLSFPATDDHPDAAPVDANTVDTSEFNQASIIPLDPLTGQGNATGNIEINSDTDLFTFDAPAGGPATVIISRPVGSTLRQRVSIVDATGHILASGIAPDDLVFTTASASITAVRGTRYYVVVSPFNDINNPNVNTTDTGLYTVAVTAPPVDDYPNAGEFSIAAAIPIDFTTGVGQLGSDTAGDPSNPRLSPTNDTDLFTFTTVRQGDVAIRVTPFDTALGHFAPVITLYNAQGVQIQQVTATQPLQDTTLNLSAAPANTPYFVLVSAAGGVPLATLTGEYRIRVVGPANQGGGGGGGGVDSIDFNNPTPVPLDQRTGDGQTSDQISPIGDRDLYTFTTTAAGKVFLQLVAPGGSPLRASIRVLSQPNELASSEVVFDADGIPGAIANVSFDGAANKQYWVVVDGLGDSTGSYTIKVNTQPVVNRLVFPEGFANDNIREFVSIVNPGDVTATYTLILRYESGSLETQVVTRSIAPHSRGGETIIDGKNYQSPGIRLNTPYSVILESDQPLGATLAHYDFGHSIGDSLSETASATWNFARVEKTPGSVLDFVVFYNVSAFDVTATLTVYDAQGNPHSLSRTFGALRRGGFAINDIAQFPTGIYGATLTVVNAADGTPAPVVASLSHYNTTGDAAFGLLGDPTGGTNNGIITNVAQGQHNNAEVDFFNPGTAPITLTLVGNYIRTPQLPQFVKNFTIQAKRQLKITGASLGLSPDQPIGIRYSTDGGPVVATSDQVQLGDADSTSAATLAGTRAFFGDAFIDTRSAGVNYFETIWLANPTNVASTITLKLDFFDGATAIIPVSVAAHGYAELRLHQRPEILGRPTPQQWYSIDISSAIPFVASMTHYDLAIGGGWATSGVPFGITMPLNTIPA